MPAPGQQHSSIVNPFEEPQKRMTEYTAQEIATLQARLNKQLGPEYLSSRPGPSNTKVHYISAEKCITLANEVFGFNGWSSSIQNIQIDFVDENPQTMRVSMGLSVIVRVTLRDGTFHEDIGYGSIENAKGKAAAFEKSKKEGTTDALKRVLRNFGNALGLCVYDKSYLQKVTKIKAEPIRFNEGALLRHGDFAVKSEADESVLASVKAESGVPSRPQLPSEESLEDFLGDFDEADFAVAEDGHPDEVALLDTSVVSVSERPSNQNITQDTDQNSSKSSTSSMHPPSRPLARSNSTGSSVPRQPQTPNHDPSRASSVNPVQNNRPNGPRPPPHQNRPSLNQNGNLNANSNGPQAHQPPAPNGNGPPSEEPVGFFSARAVSKLPEIAQSQVAGVPQGAQAFDPKFESPSIRRTPGIDHSASKPVGRNGQHKPPATTSNDNAETDGGGPGSGPAKGSGSAGGMSRPGLLVTRGNSTNAQFEQMRRIGAPGGGASPLANRSQYRPPTMKRPAGDPNSVGAGRPPLGDVSGNAVSGPNGLASGPDTKRQKVG